MPRMDLYQPAVIRTWKQSRSRLPLEQWIKIVGRQLPQFATDDDIYRAIPLCVKIAGNLGNANGNVSMSINGVTDKQWYNKLCSALTEMTGKSNIKVVNYLGEDISNFSHHDLRNAGELDVIDAKTGKEIRLAAPVEPPKYMSNNKIGELRTWWESHRDKLASLVADQLKGKTMAEIAAATVENGPIQKALDTYLEKSGLHNMSWTKFASTYAQSASRVCDVKSLSNGLLHTVRAALKANEPQIRALHAQMTIASSAPDAASLWSTPAGTGDDCTIYRDIAEDAMYNPLVGRNVVNAIAYPIGNHCKYHKKPHKHQKSSRLLRGAVGPHPLNDFYNKYYVGRYDKLPGHVLQRYNSNTEVASSYAGDLAETMKVFHMLTGRHLAPSSKSTLPPLVPANASIGGPIGMPKLIPIGDDLSDDEEVAPVGNRVLPKLIPIGDAPVGNRVLPKLIPIGDDLSDDEEVAPVGNRVLPKLVPINAPVLPKLVPIGKALPKLVPIADNYGMPDLDAFL
jgi:hypothetical protein